MSEAHCCLTVNTEKQEMKFDFSVLIVSHIRSLSPLPNVSAYYAAVRNAQSKFRVQITKTRTKRFRKPFVSPAPYVDYGTSENTIKD